MPSGGSLSRREFLKLAGLTAGLALQASSWPGKAWFSTLHATQWPSISPQVLPERLRRILQLVPRAQIDTQGRLELYDAQGHPQGLVPLVPTQWNLENSHAWDRLYSDVKWGLVLHWFGNDEREGYGVQNFMYGFDELRPIMNYITRTSAHFLVGGAPPLTADSPSLDPLGIVQTQAADRDGTPFVASHLQQINYQEHREKKQYFVRALYQLGYQDASITSLLQDIFDGRRMDPNMRTIAIEISGRDFEHGETQPSERKLANVLAVVWAVMQRYGIRAMDILGHHEITINKPDPGKKFMALMRLLLGVKALVETDTRMKELVFGQHLSSGRQPWQAIQAYFKFVRDFQVLVDRPLAVYDWERNSGYWFVYDLTTGSAARALAVTGFRKPFQDAQPCPTSTFTIPQHHEGVDLVRDGPLALDSVEVRLAGVGECLFTGESHGYHPGKLAIFRHRQPDGAQVLTVYGNLERLAVLQPGKIYPAGEVLGASLPTLQKDHLLHFAVGYGATWESDLQSNPNVPLNVGLTWILQRYLHPVEYLSQHLEPPERRGWTMD